jgi:hypothetical protein
MQIHYNEISPVPLLRHTQHYRGHHTTPLGNRPLKIQIDKDRSFPSLLFANHYLDKCRQFSFSLEQPTIREIVYPEDISQVFLSHDQSTILLILLERKTHSEPHKICFEKKSQCHDQTVKEEKHTEGQIHETVRQKRTCKKTFAEKRAFVCSCPL